MGKWISIGLGGTADSRNSVNTTKTSVTDHNNIFLEYTVKSNLFISHAADCDSQAVARACKLF